MVVVVIWVGRRSPTEKSFAEDVGPKRRMTRAEIQQKRDGVELHKGVRHPSRSPVDRRMRKRGESRTKTRLLMDCIETLR